MSDAKDRLSRLIELAMESAPEKQRALAFELCDLLLDWPQRYPSAMREPFEALLEKALRRLDGTTRRMIAARLAGQGETTLALLNAFYFDVPLDRRAAILMNNAAAGGETECATDATADARLIDAARRLRGQEFSEVFGCCLQIPAIVARRIMNDDTGDALAVACKGGHIGRATYSVLALLTMSELRSSPAERHARLARFEEIPLAGAERLLASWRRPHDAQSPQEADSKAA